MSVQLATVNFPTEWILQQKHTYVVWTASKYLQNCFRNILTKIVLCF